MNATETGRYSITKEGTRNVHWYNFPNWYDFIETAQNGTTDVPDGVRLSNEESLYGNSGWHGASVEETFKLAKTGWAEGTALLRDQIKTFENIMPSRRVRQETVMDITGRGVLDFGRWATGHPEAWMVQQDTEVTDSSDGNIIRMVFNVSASSGVGTSEMMRKGATVVGLIDLLEQAGKRVELDLVAGSRGEVRNSKHSIRVVVRVKESDAPVDIERLAFAMAHPATLRRLNFKIWEQAPVEARTACSIPTPSKLTAGGYGKPEDFEAIVDDKAIYIGASSLYKSYDEAVRVAWVKEELAKQGVVFED